MNKNTANYGAAQTRAEIKRAIKRQLRGCRKNSPEEAALRTIIDFIASMAKRSGKRKGGLGRR